MANNTILGIDVGHDQLKLALTDNGTVMDAVSVTMPENLFKEGRFTSAEMLSDLIGRTMKENGIKAKKAAYVLPNETVYIKNVKMPMMTTEQLAYNLPYEFSDYITGEIKDYVFDYAVLPDDESAAEGEEQAKEENAQEAPEEEKQLSLMAVGAEVSLIEDVSKMLGRTGLKLVKAAPSLCSYISLIRDRREVLSQFGKEYGILDLGFESVRMYIFDDDRHEATRVLETGLSALDNVVANLFNVEKHLAHTYILNNFEGCLDREECRETFESIAVELMRAMNFYRFSNPDSTLSDIWLCGGGAFIKPLQDAIGEMMDMRLHTASDLIRDGEEIPGCNSFVQAVGITMD